jgi:hypothetical protein
LFSHYDERIETHFANAIRSSSAISGDISGGNGGEGISFLFSVVSFPCLDRKVIADCGELKNYQNHTSTLRTLSSTTKCARVVKFANCLMLPTHQTIGRKRHFRLRSETHSAITEYKIVAAQGTVATGHAVGRASKYTATPRPLCIP